MNIFSKNIFAAFAALLPLIAFAGPAAAADTPREPQVVLRALSDRIYVLGETTASAADMMAAETDAADEIRRYVASGSTAGLLAKEKSEQSPLLTAAYLGYPNVVAALLTSGLVQAHLNDADDMGLTPWIAANLSMRQSLWSCNPSVFENPFKFVPMLVTQPYYISNPVPPYKKTKEVLEKAGAASDVEKARAFWQKNCSSQSEEARAKVQAGADFQTAVQELGTADLGAAILRMQKKAKEQRH